MWLLVVPVLLLLGVLTALQYRQGMADAERELLRRAGARAQELEAVARPSMAHVHDLRVMLQQRWHAPPDGGAELRAALRAVSAQGQTDGWSLDAAQPAMRQRFGQFWYAQPGGVPPPDLWLHRAQAFVEQARVVHDRAHGFVATWFAAADTNTSFGYPWVDTAHMLRAMQLPSLQAIAAPRQEAVARSVKALAADPNDVGFWGPPYVSQLDGQLVLSHGAMVVVDGRYQGEVSLDFRLDELQAHVLRWRNGAERLWIVNARHQVLADSVQALAAPPGTARADTRVVVSLSERLPGGLTQADIDAALFMPDRMRTGDGWVLAAGLRIGSPWTYMEAVPMAELRAQVLPALLPNALLALALLGMFVAGQWLLTRQFVDPAMAVLAYLRELSESPATPEPRLGRRWRGWVAAVTATFARQRELQHRENINATFKSALIDHAPMAVVTTDGAGRLVEFNPAAEAMFGLAREQALGQPVGDVLIPPRRRSQHRAAQARVLAGERGPAFERPLEMTGWRADGSEFPMETVAYHVTVEGQDFYTGFMTDLSARREVAQQIERQRDALRQSEKLSAMGSLLAGVAHELNNPLAIVMGRASLLEEKTEGSELATDALRIREAAERCGRIVRTFLNMARQKPAERSAVPLNDVARAAAEMLGYTLRSHDIEIVLNLAAELPTVQADGDQIGQVVLNLVVNAQQALATHTGRRRITLESGVSAAPAGGVAQVWLTVMDSGPGIAAALHEKVFEPFFTTKAEGIGTGLGLSVSRAIVREHGGELVLQTSSQGACFRLSLPMDAVALAPLAQDSAAVADAEPLSARILVVDDEPEVADVMRAMLEDSGFEVVTAESGAVALELLDMAHFDGVISDLRMPDVDGSALWRQVRQRHPQLAQRMLFVTGDSLSPDARTFLQEAQAPSLDKPFRKATLLAALRQLLGP